MRCVHGTPTPDRSNAKRTRKRQRRGRSESGVTEGGMADTCRPLKLHSEYIFGSTSLMKYPFFAEIYMICLQNDRRLTRSRIFGRKERFQKGTPRGRCTSCRRSTKNSILFGIRKTALPSIWAHHRAAGRCFCCGSLTEKDISFRVI